jgi:MFS family permease
VFFPETNSLTGTLASFGTQFVGFAARPIGAAIFGHYGDRLGRKGALITTLSLMGAATALMGVIPGYSRIGFWAPVLLVLLRVLQGIGVGGEWGGSVLMSMEWGKRKWHGFMGSLPQLGVPIGLLLATLALRLTGAETSKAQFMSWGWRIPFLISVVLIAIGLYVRLSVLETPHFARVKQENAVFKQPVWEVIKTQPRAILTSAFVRMAEQAPFYLFTSFVLSYGTEALKVSKESLLNNILVAAAIGLVTVPLFGFLSDLFGRRTVYGVGIVAIGAFAFPYFHLLNTTTAGLMLLAVVLSLVLHDIMYGPQAALIAETFGTGVRYSGAGLGYQLASVVAGGPAPLIATALLATYNTWVAIAAYITACAVISVIAAVMMKDYTNQDISAEYDAPIAIQ